MKKYITVVIIIFLPLVGCQNPENTNDMEKWRFEIMEVEKAFNEMAQDEGLGRAFEFYAAENGVIRRNEKIIKGKKAIAEWYTQNVKPNETLSWKPTFVDVSASGEMAYTYGDYSFTYLDSLNTEKENKGVFHTVWKRQNDGTWRFVWD